MDWNFYIAAIIGFVPSFGILYFTWGKLEGLFSEKKLFFNYFMGWIIGIPIAIFFLLGMVSVWSYFDLSLMFLLFFAMFTELTKYIYLNTPSKRGDYSLTYYGFALGLGIAAIWTVSLAYYYLNGITSNPDEQITEAQYAGAALSLFLMSTGMSATHASTGSLLGYGIYKKFWEKYMLMAFGIQMLFNLTLLPYMWMFPYYYFFFGILVGIPVLYYKVYKGVLIYTIPKRVMRKWKKERESL